LAQSPSFEAFPTLAQAREHLRLRDSDHESDGLVCDLLSRVARMFESETRRKLKLRTYADELINGTGESTIFLPEYPVVSISSIAYSSDRAFATSTALTEFDGTGSQSTFDYTFDEDTGEVMLLNGDVWPSGRATVRATYIAGLGASNAEDLVQGQLLALADLYNFVGRDPGVQSVSLGGLSKTFTGGVTDAYPWHAKIASIIALYRRASFE